MSHYVTVDAEVHLDDVLRRVDDETIARVLIDRRTPTHVHVERIWLHYRNRTDAPDCVRSLVYDVLGRVL